MNVVVDLEAFRKRKTAEAQPKQTDIQCGCGEYMWQGTWVGQSIMHGHDDQDILACLGCTAIVVMGVEG